MWADNQRTGTWLNADPKWVKEFTQKTMKAYHFGPRQIDKWTRDGHVIKRTVRGAPAFDTNYFRLCDEEDPGLRFGIWNNDESLFLNMLRPLPNKRREVNIRFIDFRQIANGGVTASADWCTIGTAANLGKLGSCVLRYCFDFNEHYETGRQALTPNDFAENCYRDSFFDMDGNMITDEETYQDFGVFLRMRDSILDQVINGTGVMASGSAAKGLKLWFKDFADDHPEIATCSWIAPKYIHSAIQAADVGATIETRIRALRDYNRDMRMQGNGTVQDDFDEGNFTLMLSERSAECVIKAHVCATVCATPVGVQVSSPEEYRQWKMLYPHYLTGGRFGQGYIVTPNGMTIDIQQSRRMQDTDMFLIFNGSASDPEAGLRLTPYDYTPYIDYLSRKSNRSVVTGGDKYIPAIESLYGGSVLALQNPAICDDRMYRWNFAIVDRKPWMQTYWDALDTTGCDAPVHVALPDLPDAVGQAAHC